MITGSLVAIVTPMQADGRLDLARFRSLIDWHIAEGTDGIVVVGTTGESPTVDFDEHKELIRIAVEHAGGRIPVIAGTGGNSTQEAIYLTQRADKAGADASLQVTPYYNKPTQEGLFQHFHAVACSTHLPSSFIASRDVAGSRLAWILVNRLAHDSVNIVGSKEAGGNPDRVSQLRARHLLSGHANTSQYIY